MNPTAANPQPDLPTHQPLTDGDYRRQILRLITCGSVDDGKSTLMGRLLLDADMVFDDQLAALKLDSAKHGTNGQELDPALLLDGLQDEREQGITIDVAYRYFSTAKRKFIIADCPGHVQFTRNMVTGASLADLGVILVDATRGLLNQTKRHAFILALMGIKHVILAVNKMDRVGYREQVFQKICDDFRDFAARLEIPDIRFVPVSALRGDQVVKAGSNMPWYSDGTLLHLLETVYVGSDANRKDFRFPVQRVNRPDSSFRGYSGTVASGTIRVGEPIQVLPSGQRSRVRDILTMNGSLPSAAFGQSITLVLEDERDITRGDVIVRPGNKPVIGSQADVMLVWMSEESLDSRRSYWLKQLGQKTSCEIKNIRYCIDVETLHRKPVDTLGLNEIGRCQIRAFSPLIFDSYRQNRETGSFILVDRMSHQTVAAGLFLESQDTDVSNSQPETSPSVMHHNPLVTTGHRRQAYGHFPLTVIVSADRTERCTELLRELEKLLVDGGIKTVLLDRVNQTLGLPGLSSSSAADANRVLRQILSLTGLLNAAGLVCLVESPLPAADLQSLLDAATGSDPIQHVHLAAEPTPDSGAPRPKPVTADLLLSAASMTPFDAAREIEKWMQAALQGQKSELA